MKLNGKLTVGVYEVLNLSSAFITLLYSGIFSEYPVSVIKFNNYAFIGTKAHGYMDYLIGAVLMGAPWLFNFERGGAETWIPVILGAGALVYSLMTDYELGATRTISMRTHLMLDFMSGLLLAVSPWLFGFAEFVWEPHLIFGIFEMGAALCTTLHPSNERSHHRQQGRHTAATSH